MKGRTQWASVGLCLYAVTVSGCGIGEAEESSSIQTVPVARGNLRIVAEATGSVEPVRRVEVKSKASGEVLRLHADVGGPRRGDGRAASPVGTDETPVDHPSRAAFLTPHPPRRVCPLIEKWRAAGSRPHKKIARTLPPRACLATCAAWPKSARPSSGFI